MTDSLKDFKKNSVVARKFIVNLIKFKQRWMGMLENVDVEGQNLNCTFRNTEKSSKLKHC